MVEHAAVNRVVVGSSPTSGAILNCECSKSLAQDGEATVSETVSKSARAETIRQYLAELH